jgi:enterochelin esterase-like enzyme
MLALNIAVGPVPITVYVLTVIGLGLVLWRTFLQGWRWGMLLVAASGVGVLIAWVVLWVTVDWLNLFGGQLEQRALPWIYGAFAALAAAVCGTVIIRGWARWASAATVLLVLLAGTLGVNAAYGLTPRLGSFLHLQINPTIELPAVRSYRTSSSTPPLATTWVAPNELPQQGLIGVIAGGIPNTRSGFPARAAEIYLPPAALVEHPPQLPLMVFMLGQPGDPEPALIAPALDAYARDHAGLAPITVVIDQLGNPAVDPLCIDGPRGNVESYVVKDVVPWLRTHLNIAQDRSQWTIAGFSNGGGCASYYAAKYPETWGNMISVSGVEFPGVMEQKRVLKAEFHGDQEAFEAIKPANIMLGRTYPDTVAVFTTGELDTEYGAGQERLARAAQQAGMTVTFRRFSGVGHNNDALRAGLPLGFTEIFARQGLSK